jgi:hypothetical protein
MCPLLLGLRVPCQLYARELELFLRQLVGLVLLGQLQQGKGGLRAPGQKAGLRPRAASKRRPASIISARPSARSPRERVQVHLPPHAV